MLTITTLLLRSSRSASGELERAWTSQSDRHFGRLGNLAVIKASMSRNTSVSRNGAGSAAIAARSCSASILAMRVASGVGASGSPGLACASSTASRSSTVTTEAGRFVRSQDKRRCEQCLTATLGRYRRRNFGWRGMRAAMHPAPHLRRRCDCPSASAPADRHRQYEA